ncbi:PepSY-associated TM helix domain-containing protein [Hyphobacterium sp. HN65]|uniref:PepSY-associated TM helix domain-containing protein n=1 Tax=Hyphobacterium lacteum TaxID=3116575 RepID=A0ABU7LRT2_9PROT|nr:PepSY-associated TM helix domain-containing protein [Hyphobacterium sp. HN65]MEE2526351.1 PepSY-associated TM helix domain-containing protein [Hyphobacterium sp. HN65]
MRAMTVNKLFRDIHHWGSLALMIPLGIMIVAGIFLMLKKDIDWIQPPTQRSAITVDGPPSTTLVQLYESAAAIPELEITGWDQFDRIDIRSDRGIAKFIAPNRWEAQIDLTTLEVLSLEYRRSDLFEQIHDGSFFADWVKLYVFLPAGVLLFVLWLTGIWLFFLPHVKRWQRRKKRAAKLKEA